MAGFRRCLRRGGDDRRAGRLVCGGGAVQTAARPADPAHRDHPGEPEPHRRQSRPLHRGQFPGARAGARKACRGRLFRTRRRLAGRPQPRRRSVAFRRPAGAADTGGDRAIRPARLRQQPHAGADRKGAAGAARRRVAVGPDRRPPPPKTIRRIHQGGRPLPERRAGAGDDAREDPRGTAVAVQPVSRRRLSA